jgi:hypothetical protein
VLKPHSVSELGIDPLEEIRIKRERTRRRMTHTPRTVRRLRHDHMSLACR